MHRARFVSAGGLQGGIWPRGDACVGGQHTCGECRFCWSIAAMWRAVVARDRQREAENLLTA